MKMNHIVYCFLAIFLASCSAAKIAQIGNVYQNRYKDKIPATETIILGTYQYVSSQTQDGSYKLRVFYPEKFQCTAENTYSDKNLKTKNGPFVSWTDKGKISVKGQYENDEKSGEWLSYNFDTGALYLKTNYTNGKINGLQESFDDGILRSSYTYLNNERNGPFTVYDSLGNVYNQGQYKDDLIIEQTLEENDNPNPDEEEFKIVELMPMFSGCEEIEDYKVRKTCAQNLMLRHIYSNVKYPARARERDVEGTAVIRFVVDKEGYITEIVAIKGVQEDIEKEALRVVREMPKWHPGTQGGVPVKVQFNLPIKFRLE